MFNAALIAVTSVAVVQAEPAMNRNEDQATAALIAEMEAMEPSDGEPAPVADRRLYTGRDVCTVLMSAYPVLGLSGWDGQPRKGEWRSIPFVQEGLRISGPWGACIQKWRQFFPQLHELLITVDGRQALVSGGNLQGGECRFVKAKGSWRKVTCFNTWVE